MLILGLLGMRFDVVFVTSQTLLLRLALAILWYLCFKTTNITDNFFFFIFIMIWQFVIPQTYFWFQMFAADITDNIFNIQMWFNMFAKVGSTTSFVVTMPTFIRFVILNAVFCFQMLYSLWNHFWGVVTICALIERQFLKLMKDFVVF